MVNAWLNWVKAHLASRVKKIGFSASRIYFVNSDLADFLLFPPLLLITLLLSTLIASKIPAGWGLVFNIEVSGAAILLKPWMKR